MSKKRIVPVVLLLAAAGAAAWYWYRVRGEEDGRLRLAGTIEARTVEVGSLVGGRVAAVHVEEGAAVAAGQPLVTFEPDLLDLDLAQQRALVEQTRANLARVESGPRSEEVARARIEWQAAEIDRKRLQSLWEAGVISRQQYDGAVVRERTARETLREAERGSRQEDVAAARAALVREEERLAYLARQRQEMVVAAPAAGVVETLDLRPGDLVAANQPVASILESGQLWVRVYVPEPALGRVRVGQAAAVEVDSFPGRAFPGRVVEIRDQAEYTPRNVQTLDQRSDQFFGVKVRVEPAPELKAGMSALVRLAEDPAVAPVAGREARR
jgi:HlyD family secretion protein